VDLCEKSRRSERDCRVLHLSHRDWASRSRAREDPERNWKSPTSGTKSVPRIWQRNRARLGVHRVQGKPRLEVLVLQRGLYLTVSLLRLLAQGDRSGIRKIRGWQRNPGCSSPQHSEAARVPGRYTPVRQSRILITLRAPGRQELDRAGAHPARTGRSDRSGDNLPSRLRTRSTSAGAGVRRNDPGSARRPIVQRGTHEEEDQSLCCG